MGIAESKCVFLGSETALMEESYTVTRTSGELESSWFITKDRHFCVDTRRLTWVPGAHASLKKEGWRVFLANPKEGDGHACGWRRIGTFWPSRLDGDQAAIDAWVTELKTTLERLAVAQGLPTVWVEHVCHLGSPKTLCGGCFSEDEAKRKIH